MQLTSNVVILNKVGKFAELTIDMEETAYKAFTGIRAIDHSIFQKHLEDRFQTISSPNFKSNEMEIPSWNLMSDLVRFYPVKCLKSI